MMIMIVMMNKAELNCYDLSSFISRSKYKTKRAVLLEDFFSCPEEKLFSLFLQYFIIFKAQETLLIVSLCFVGFHI